MQWFQKYNYYEQASNIVMNHAFFSGCLLSVGDLIIKLYGITFTTIVKWMYNHNVMYPLDQKPQFSY